MSLRSSICASVFGMMFAACAVAQDVPAPTSMSFGYVDGGDTVQISVSNGDVVATLNGQPMPEGRLQEQGQQLRCMDANGRLVAVLNCNGSGGTLQTLPRFKPRLRLGVTVAQPDEALAEHLGLDGEKCLHVTAVIEDKAGDKAGLLPHDIIVSLDGSESATREELQALLAEKSEGDRVVLDLIRRGVRTALEVELEAEDYNLYTGYPRLDLQLPTDKFVSGYYLDPATNLSQNYLNNVAEYSDFQQQWDVAVGNQMFWAKPDAEGQPDYAKYVSPEWAYTYNLMTGEPAKVVEGVPVDVSLESQLERLEDRLDKLEALLAGLNKKLK